MMSAVSKESEDESEAAGTSSMMESTMMEGEEYYNPETTVAWTEKVPGAEQLCRICANTNEYLIPIFSGEGLEHQLGMKIEKHLPIQVVEEDKLPLHVCYQCASTLIAWHDLVIGCVEAEKKLRQVYQQRNEEEEEDGYADDDKTDFFDEPVDNEIAEDPLKPSTSASATTRSTRTPRKKTVTRAKPKLKMTLVKTPPAILPKSSSKLLQPKEEQVEPDAATERAEEMELSGVRLSTTDNSTSVKLERSDSIDPFDHHTNIVPRVPGTCRSPQNKELDVELNTGPDETLTEPSSHRDAGSGKKKMAHVTCYTTKEEGSQKIIHSSCAACGSDGITNADLVQHIQFKCVPSASAASRQFAGISFKTIDTRVSLPRKPIKPRKEPDVEPTSDASVSNPPLSGDEKATASKSGTVLAKASFKKTRRRTNIRLKNLAKTFVKCRICFKRFPSQTDLDKHVEAHEMNRCNVCNIYLVSKKEQETHYKKHVDSPDQPEEPTSYLCPTCGEVFPSSKTFRHHVLKHHTAPTHTCDICGFKSSFSKQLKDHMVRHSNVRPFMCETCGRGFYTRSAMTSHQAIHNDNRPYSCTECDSRFKSARHRKLHEILMHGKQFGNNTAFTCVICNQRCLSKSRLSDHMNSHTGERPYECELCKKCFRNRHTLNQHKALHKVKTYLFECDACEKKCNTRADLNKHMRTNHGAEEVMFPCDKCDKSFPSKAGVFRHNYFVHKMQLGKNHKDGSHGNKYSRHYSCNDCNGSFSSKRYLLSHLNTVHNKKELYACNDCDKTYTHPSFLNKHIETLHANAIYLTNVFPSYPCPHCDKTWTTKTWLNKHIESVHTDLKFLCCECNKTYKSFSSLYNHKKLMHMQNQILECSVCGKVCRGKYSLTRHMLSHNEKTFSCEFCGKMLRRKWDLDTHMRTHTGEKPFQCTMCELSFAQQGTRNQHMQNIHKTNYVAPQ